MADYRSRVLDELSARANADLSRGFRKIPDETLNRMRTTALASTEIARILRSFMQNAQQLQSSLESCNTAIDEQATESDIKAKVEQCAKAVEALQASQSIKMAIDTASGAFSSRRASLSSELEKTRQQIAQARKQQTKIVDITSTAVIYTVPIVGFLMLLILLGPLGYGRDVQLAIFQNALLLELLTVYLLIATILLLGLSEKIDKNALGTLLGGISGYVLGRTLASRTQMGAIHLPGSGGPPVPDATAPPPSPHDGGK